MRAAIKLIIFLFILCSCSAIGTKTLYKTTDEVNIKKIGFCRLESEDRLSRIFYNTNEIFDSTVILTFLEYGLEMPSQIQTDISYETPDLIEISNLCNKNDLDGFLVAKLTFIHVEYTMYSEPIIQNFDTEVELKLFDKKGKLLISTLHNTLHGNSYMMPPPPNMTIHDGAKGAIKRLTKEMRLKKIK